MLTQTDVLHRWSAMPAEPIGSLMTRRYFSGERMTIAYFELKRAAGAHRHAHNSEELMCVLTGTVKVAIDGHDIVVGPGEFAHIPAGVEHQLDALADATVIDVCSPVRRDWHEKTDNYFYR